MITVKRKVQIARDAHGRRRVTTWVPESGSVERGRVPRVSRLLALAIRLERLLLSGEVSDVSELARISHVSQPRMSQILNLALLAPDIQEELLFLPRVTSGTPDIHEKILRPIVAQIDWQKQRELWRALQDRSAGN
jgi:hypothetical protein